MLVEKHTSSILSIPPSIRPLDGWWVKTLSKIVSLHLVTHVVSHYAIHRRKASILVFMTDTLFGEIDKLTKWICYYSQGQFFSGSAYRIYLLGNPIIWWSNLIFLTLFLIIYFVSAVKDQRGYKTENHGSYIFIILCFFYVFFLVLHSNSIRSYTLHIHKYERTN